MMMYPLGPNFEHKARKFNKALRMSHKTLDLLTAELYVNNPEWSLDLEPDEADRVPRWFGCGVLISKPPWTTAERIRAALGTMCQELSKLPGASEMRITVEKL